MKSPTVHFRLHLGHNITVKSQQHRFIELKNKQDDVMSEAIVDFSLEPRNIIHILFFFPKCNSLYIFIYKDPFILYIRISDYRDV